MITFLADDHYNAHPGAALHEAIAGRFSIAFAENDLSPLEAPGFAEKTELLILNVIGETCGQPAPSAAAEKAVRAYVEAGKPLLLLHGSSAAFWQWAWWREIVGLRWVRGGDPDGVEPSTHPVRPYRVDVSKCRHPLCKKLQPMDLGEDEIYTRLEQVCPVTVLLETTTVEGTFPQAWENTTPWGGRVIGFLPGHKKEIVQAPAMVANAVTLIEDLLAKK
ncbi:MAG: ThuA domain-containing protein [Chthoniobacteraceae bacterium]